MSAAAVLLWLCVVACVYAAFVLALVVAGRRDAARAAVRFVPDCIVLVRRLVADDRVARRHKLLLAAVLAYLVVPLDLVPDFIPIAGQLDDALLVALALRALLRRSGAGVIEELWPGPPASLDVVLRLAGGSRAE